MDRDTRESYIIAKRSQRCTPRTGRDARETHRSRCIAKDKYIYILKREKRRHAVEFRDRWMKERSTMEKSCLLFFEEDDQKHFRPILFRFSNNYLHPIGWPSALEIRLSVVNWNKWKIDIYYG